MQALLIAMMVPDNIMAETVEYCTVKVLDELREVGLYDSNNPFYFPTSMSKFSFYVRRCSCGRCHSCKNTASVNRSIAIFTREQLPRMIEEFSIPYLSVYSAENNTLPLMISAVNDIKKQDLYYRSTLAGIMEYKQSLVNLDWRLLVESACLQTCAACECDVNGIINNLSDIIFGTADTVFTQGDTSSEESDIHIETDFSPSDSGPAAPRASLNMGSFFDSHYVPDDTSSRSIDIVKQLETYGLFLTSLSTQTSWSGYLSVVGLFLNTHYNISLVDPAMRWIYIIVDNIRSECVSTQGSVELPLEGESIFHHLVNGWKSISNSVLISKIKQLAALLSSLLACNLLGFTLTGDKFKSVWEKLSDGAGCVDMFAQVLHNLMWILDRGISYLSGEVRFMDIFSCETAGQAFDIKYSKLMGSVDELEACTGKELYTPEQALMLILKMRDDCEKLMRKSKTKVENAVFCRQIERLTALATRINIVAANSEIRRAPFAISFNGDSGVGKSVITGLVAVTLQRALDIGVGSRFVHSHNPDDKYFSGYTAYTNCIMLDDIANTNSNFVDESPSNVIIAIINNQPRFAVMADVTDKGKLAIKPDIVIGTTNIPMMGASIYTNEPLSMLRRFKYHITMRVKDEFKKPGTNMLDPTVDAHQHSHDLWYFDVQEAIAEERSAGAATSNVKSGAKFVPIVYDGRTLMNINFADLLLFLVHHSRIHKEQQVALVARANSLQQAEFCEHCLPVSVCNLCDTVATQSGSFCVSAPIKYLAVAKLFYKVSRTNWQLLVLQQLLSWAFIYTIILSLPGIDSLLYMMSICFASLITTVSLQVYQFRSQLRKLCKPGESIVSMLNATNLCQRLAVNGASVIKSHYKVASAALAVVTGMYVAYNCFYKMRIDTQGSMFARPIPPEIKQNKDPWRRAQVEKRLVNFDMRTTTGKQLSESLVSHLSILRVHDEDSSKGTQCLCFPIKTGFWLVPYHVIVIQRKYVSIQSFSDDVLNSTHRFIRAGTFARIGDTDFAVLYVPGKGDTKNYLNAFPEKLPILESRPARVAWARRVENGSSYPTLDKGVSPVNVTTARVSPVNCAYSYHGGEYVFSSPTWDGLCGAPLCVEGGGTYILGVHSAGQTGTTTARYCTVLRGDIVKTINGMVADDTICMQGADSSTLTLDYPEFGFPFKEGLKPNSKTNWVEGDYKVLGHHDGQLRTFRSKVVKTVISDAVEAVMDVPCATGPPAYLNSWVPWHMWLKSCGSPCPLPTDWLNKSYACLKGKIFSYLNDHVEYKDAVHPLTDDNVLAGADGVRGCYALNFNASAGLPWCKPKREYMVDSEREVPGISCPKDIPEWMHTQIRLWEDTLAQGKRIYAPHRGNVKDEPIPIDKVKVRVFSGTNMVYLFLMRRYFLTISMLMQELPHLFECAIGINCYSREWDELAAYVTQFGVDRIVAGDYKGFDQVISSQMTMAAFKLLIAIAEWAGYTPRQLTIMRGLATETCFPVYEICGEYVQFNCTNPSGHPLTGVVNNIVNSLYARFVFYKNAPSDNTYRFHEVVALICYGDDSKMSVSEECYWFDHTVMQDTLGEYGIVYTMADKTSVSTAFVNDSDASFLKRYFRYDAELGRTLAPLEEKSIFKSLHTVVKSDFMSLEEQSVECVKNANREYFFYGREKFNLRRNELNQILLTCGLDHYLYGHVLPDYDQVKEWYLEQ